TAASPDAPGSERAGAGAGSGAREEARHLLDRSGDRAGGDRLEKPRPVGAAAEARVEDGHAPEIAARADDPSESLAEREDRLRQAVVEEGIAAARGDGGGARPRQRV